MASEKPQINYKDVLADLKARRIALDAAIAAIEQMNSSGSVGAISEGTTIDYIGELPSDAFFGMSVPSATKKFLTMKKKPQSTQEIADALEAGGLTHSSENFTNTVSTSLHRLKKDEEGVVRVSRGKWGLMEWYPGRKRGKASEEG